MKSDIQNLGYGVLLGISLSCLVIACVDYIKLPTVYTDHLSNKCVKVVGYDGKEGDCNNLPEKYHHEYVVRVAK